MIINVCILLIIINLNNNQNRFVFLAGWAWFPRIMKLNELVLNLRQKLRD